ncbi:MAG: cytochrome-c peroxidase, partial [Verrucomicrobia bacterium]
LTCHMSPTIGGNSYQKVGLIHAYENTKDKGRYEVTKDEADLYKFKVPSLRNVALTAPYFHDGAMKTLEGTIWKMGWMQLGRELKDDEVQAIAAFLRSLTDKERAAK